MTDMTASITMNCDVIKPLLQEPSACTHTNTHAHTHTEREADNIGEVREQ